MQNISRSKVKKMLAVFLAVMMILQVVNINSFQVKAATTYDVSDTAAAPTDMIYTITDASETYTFTGTIDGQSNSIAIVVDVGAGNTASITFSNVNITRGGQCNVSNGAVLQVQSGTVNIELDGSNSLINGQDAQGGVAPAVKIEDGAEVVLTGSGSLIAHGTSNYYGGGDAIQGGTLTVNGPTLYARGGNKIQNEYGACFSGTTLNVVNGTVEMAKGALGTTSNGSFNTDNCTVGTGGIIRSDTIYVTAEFENQGTVEASSITVSSVFKNQGTVKGNIVVSETGTLENNGTIINSISNQGTISNTGRMEGTVTSSNNFTSTGTALTSADENDFTDTSQACYVKELNCTAGTVTISGTKIDDLTLSNMTAGNVTISDSIITTLDGGSSEIGVGGSKVFVQNLDVGDIQATGNVDIEVFGQYINSYSDYATALVNETVKLLVKQNTMLQNKFIVQYGGKVYKGDSSTLSNLDTIFSETVSYEIGEGIEIDDTKTTHKVNEGISFYVTPADGYYIPDDFADGVKFDFGDGTVPGYATYEKLVVEEVDANTKYLVSYTINDSEVQTYEKVRNTLVIKLPDGKGKTKPDAPEVSGISYFITNTTSEMEYAASEDAATWNSCEDGETSVVPGTWYVRYKETSTTFAGAVARIKVTKNYDVTIENASTTGLKWNASSGPLTQTVAEGDSMIPVTFEVEEGYYIPYSYSAVGANGITITRNDFTSITVSGTPTESVGAEWDNITFYLVEAEKKTTQEAPMVVGIAYYITNTTSEMEYADSEDATTWNSCEEDETSVAPGTWYVRYKETPTTFPGNVAGVKVTKDFNITIENASTTGLKWNASSGPLTQTVAEGDAMISVTFEAEEGYFIPETYSVESKDGITVTRNGYTSITVSGTPTADVNTIVAAATSKYMALVVPENAYFIVAKQGKNNFFTSTVTIWAKEGYLIATSIDGVYKRSITFENTSEGVDIYFMDEEVGRTSPAVHVDGFMIDTAVPSVSVQDGEVFYGNKNTIVIEDDNLEKVLLDDEEVTLVDGKVVLVLSADGAEKKYRITAIDKAGNVTIIEYTVAAEWTKTNIIPAQEVVRLKPNKAYTLDAGVWTIEGDATHYEGGNTFYVGTENTYIFEQK